MLDQLDLVHMNGRVYDPLTAKFLSGDPLIQDPTNGQNYNRYAYVLNNPTNMTDPTGFACIKVTGSNIPVCSPEPSDKDKKWLEDAKKLSPADQKKLPAAAQAAIRNSNNNDQKNAKQGGEAANSVMGWLKKTYAPENSNPAAGAEWQQGGAYEGWPVSWKFSPKD